MISYSIGRAGMVSIQAFAPAMIASMSSYEKSSNEWAIRAAARFRPSARPWLANYPPTVPHSLEPYPEGSLYSFLEDAARRHPHAPAISFWLPGSPIGKRLSYRHLLGQVERFSGVLTSLGVQRGDRV